jgi:membrane-bound lytic murein transglycosylase D
MFLPGISISEKFIFLPILRFMAAGNGPVFIMGRNFKVKYPCMLLLLFAGVVSALWAQTGESNIPAPHNRPLRSRSPDKQNSSSFLNPHALFPASDSLLLTPEALDQPLTKYYIERYSSPSSIMWINSIIRNGSLYLPYVNDEIAKRGLPPELAYLPFIESGYLGTARSKSGATGLWQFMMNSIGPFGIKVNDMLDERRDFCKSTVAALQKLEENYRSLGNWPLALAAYNAGLGGISRAVKRVNSDDYWVLCDKKEIKSETVHYVPKFLAVSYILSRPRQYGLDYWPETVEWTAIRPGKQASLDIIAKEAGVDRNLLHRLNLELLHGITPADKNYELKVPLAQAEMVAAAFENEDLKLLQYYRYQIRYGDTLSALSRHYGISLAMIEQHNPGIQSRYLKIGETVIIPAFKETAPYTGTTDTPPQKQSGAFEGTHLVSKGDTLWSLAVHYHVDPFVLAQENNMDFNQILSIGKVLKVPIIEKESWEQ